MIAADIDAEFREIREILRDSAEQQRNLMSLAQANTVSISALTSAISAVDQRADARAAKAVETVLSSITKLSENVQTLSNHITGIVKWLVLGLIGAAVGSEGLKALIGSLA